MGTPLSAKHDDQRQGIDFWMKGYKCIDDVQGRGTIGSRYTFFFCKRPCCAWLLGQTGWHENNEPGIPGSNPAQVTDCPTILPSLGGYPGHPI